LTAKYAKNAKVLAWIGADSGSREDLEVREGEKEIFLRPLRASRVRIVLKSSIEA
jgi:hypothetical protein